MYKMLFFFFFPQRTVFELRLNIHFYLFPTDKVFFLKLFVNLVFRFRFWRGEKEQLVRILHKRHILVTERCEWPG